MNVTVIKTDGETDDYLDASSVDFIDPEVSVRDEDGNVHTYRLAEIAELYVDR